MRLQLPIPDAALAVIKPEECLALLQKPLLPKQKKVVEDDLLKRFPEKAPHFTLAQLVLLLQYTYKAPHQALKVKCLEVLKVRLKDLLTIDLEKKTIALSLLDSDQILWKTEDNRKTVGLLLEVLRDNEKPAACYLTFSAAFAATQQSKMKAFLEPVRAMIKTATIDQSEAVGGRALIACLQGFTHLESIACPSGSKMTDAELMELMHSLRSIRTLTLRGSCPNLSLVGIMRCERQYKSLAIQHGVQNRGDTLQLTSAEEVKELLLFLEARGMTQWREEGFDWFQPAFIQTVLDYGFSIEKESFLERHKAWINPAIHLLRPVQILGLLAKLPKESAIHVLDYLAKTGFENKEEWPVEQLKDLLIYAHKMTHDALKKITVELLNEKLKGLIKISSKAKGSKLKGSKVEGSKAKAEITLIDPNLSCWCDEKVFKAVSALILHRKKYPV